MTAPLTPTEPGAGSPAPNSGGATAGASDAPVQSTGAAGSTAAPASTATGPVKTIAPSSRAAPVKLPAAAIKALQVALAAEQVAVWAYDIVGAYDTTATATIAGIRSDHLTRRDATAGLITLGGGTAGLSAPAYALPTPVTDAAGALALAGVIEGDCASAWRGVIGATDDTGLRATALAGLSSSAAWLTTLKLSAKIIPATVPFPGQG